MENETYYIGEGSDWDFEVDGYPQCICTIDEEHHHSVEELWARGEFYKQLEDQKAPATGEAETVGICEMLALFFMLIIAISARKIKGGL